jgi:hypothetical protein
MCKVFWNGDNKIQNVSSSILEDITRKYFLDLFNKKIESKKNINLKIMNNNKKNRRKERENRGMLKIKLNFIFDN